MFWSDAAAWPLPPGLDVALARDGEGAPAALPPEERRRAEAFPHAERRRQFVLGRTAARALGARRLGCAPADVPIRVGADGAPEVEGAFVSIAHAGRGAEAVGAAALADRPVGVDVERVGPRRPDLWTRILAPDERPLLDALGGPTDAAQTLLWALKEAVLKGQRTGFRAGARSVRLAFDGGPPDGAPPDGGGAVAESRQSGRWRLRYGRVGGLWLAVAWADRPAGGFAEAGEVEAPTAAW